MNNIVPKYINEMEKLILRLAPINGIQKDMLIEFMQQHENLQSGRFSKDFTFKKAQGLWQEISLRLNAVPNGAKKEWKQWRKVSTIIPFSLLVGTYIYFFV